MENFIFCEVRKCQFFAYFSVLLLATVNFLEIKLLFILHCYQSRFNIYQCMFLQRIVKSFNIKQKQPSRGNIIFFVPITSSVAEYFCHSDLTFSNLQYMHVALYRVIQTFHICNGCCKSSYRGMVEILEPFCHGH